MYVHMYIYIYICMYVCMYIYHDYVYVVLGVDMHLVVERMNLRIEFQSELALHLLQKHLRQGAMSFLAMSSRDSHLRIFFHGSRNLLFVM